MTTHNCTCWQCDNTAEPHTDRGRGGIDRTAQPNYTGPDDPVADGAVIGEQLPLPNVELRALDDYRMVRDARAGNARVAPDMTHTARDLSDVNLSKLILTDAVFKRCDLTNVNFRHSDLTRAVFHECNLNDANFLGATLENTRFASCTSDHNTIWSIDGHAWKDSPLTESQIAGLRDNYKEEWRAPWVCSDCDRDENDCTCNQCDTCGETRDNCTCCSRCDQTENNCDCCHECENTRDDCTCNDDSEDSAEDNGRLFPYSTDIFDKMPWPTQNARNALVFGVELECEPDDNDASGQRDIIAALDGPKGPNYILKCDASLAFGVEIVTLPYTLDQHRAEFGWTRVLGAIGTMAKSGADTTACGMHVHINRKALSALTLGKMLVFANSESMHDLMSLIAQREPNNYCGRSTKKVTDAKHNSVCREMLNVRDNTVEVRMFRGNLRPERVIKNIEFCHALVQYARASSMQNIESVDNFIHWLIGQRGVYPALVNFLIEKQVAGFAGLKPSGAASQGEA